MGYKRRIRTMVLKFADPEFDGFEVTVKSLPVRDYLRLASLAEEAEGDGTGATAVKAMLDLLAKAVVRWNLEDEDGKPIRPSRKALDDLELDFVMSVIASWMEAMGGVDDGLGKDSPSGGTFPEVSIPMEVLSPSRAS